MRSRSLELSRFLWVTAVLSIGAVSVVSMMYVTIPLIEALADAYGARREHAIWAGSVYAVAYAVGCILIGMFADRYRKSRILVVGLLLLGLMTAAVAFSPNLTGLIMIRFIQGVVAAAFPITALAYASEVIPAPYRATTLAVLSCSFFLAGIIGQLYAQAVLTWLDWQAVFYLMAIVYVALAVIARLLPGSSAPSTGVGWKKMLRQFGGLMNRPDLIVAFAVSSTLLFSFVTMYSGLEAYIPDRFTVLPDGLMWIRIVGIPGILLSLVAGVLMRWIDAKYVFIAGLVISCIGLFGQIISISYTQIVIGSVMTVAGISVANPSILVIVGRLSGNSRAGAFAVNAAAAFVGASAGPLLAAYVHSYSTLCYILIGVLFAAMVAMLTGIRGEKRTFSAIRVKREA